MAWRIALRSASSPKGFVRNSTAPAFIALTVMGTSPRPVMKMIGMSVRSTATIFCRSRPLRSGRPTSRIKQLGVKLRGRARKSDADPKVSEAQPSHRIRSSSDSRTEISSSTTKTVGVRFAMVNHLCLSPVRSAHRKCSIECAQKVTLAEWLEEERDGPLCEQSLAKGLVRLSADEDDRNLEPLVLQFLAELRPRHARHADVEDHAADLTQAVAGKKPLRRSVCLYGIAALAQQVGQRLTHRLVVVDDRYECRSPFHAGSLNQARRARSK